MTASNRQELVQKWHGEYEAITGAINLTPGLVMTISHSPLLAATTLRRG